MKKFIIALLVLPLFTAAQVDRSKAPAPLPAPAIKIGKPVIYTLTNGLKVYVVQNSKMPRVSATLTIDNDGLVEGDKTGITSMAGELLRRGTTTLSKEQLDEAVDFLGADLDASAFSASASSLTTNFPKVFNLMADMVLRPSLPADELEKIRTQELAQLQQSMSSASAISANVISKLVYGNGHPYGDVETEASIKNVSVTDIKTLFKTYWKPNNAYLVFVGDITPLKAKALAAQYFGQWKGGTVPKPTYPAVQPTGKTYIALVDRPQSVQSDIAFIMPVQLKPGANDAISAAVMNNLLGGGGNARLFKNLREAHGFTYGAYSSLRSDRIVGTFKASASVRNEKTDSAIAEFINEFNRIRSEDVSLEDVTRTKNEVSGSFARSLEQPATIANFALNIARNNLPANYYENYLKNVAAVDAATVKTMANKYVMPGNMLIVVVGRAKDIAPGLAKFGEVKYFDNYGNPIETPVTKTVDASVTAESILQKAAAAQGNISNVKDVVMIGKTSMMGAEATVTNKYVLPATYSQAVSVNAGPMGVVEAQKEVIKDGKYFTSQMGQSSEGSAKDYEEVALNAGLFDAAYLLKQTGYTYKVTGIEKVGGEDAYGIEITMPLGAKVTQYYSVNTGLKLKQVNVLEGEGGQNSYMTTLYSNYKDVSGVKLPGKVNIDMGGMKLDINFDNIKVNSGITAADIK